MKAWGVKADLNFFFCNFSFFFFPSFMFMIGKDFIVVFFSFNQSIFCCSIAKVFMGEVYRFASNYGVEK